MASSVLAVLLLASGISSMEVPSSCGVDGSCDADDAMLLQSGRVGTGASSKEVALNQQGLSTAHLIEKLQELTDRVISGEEKITNATRLALDTIDLEMDSIIANAVQNQQDFQGTVDRAKQSVDGCSTDATTSHTKEGGIDTLAATVNSARDAHNTCRGDEATLKEDETTKCGDLNTYVAGLQMPSCSCSTAESLGSVGFKQCVASLATWSTTSNATWTTKDTLCNSATTAHSTRRASCNNMQATFESDFCTYETSLSSVCSTQETCRSTQIGLRNASHAAVAVSESAFKAEFESAKHVKCILGVLNATDALKPGMLSACSSAIVDSSHLSITYPPIPSPATCDLTPVATMPCDEDWKAAEFQGKSWNAQAPVNTCVPCPQPTTPAPPKAYEKVGDGWCYHGSRQYSGYWLKSTDMSSTVEDCKAICSSHSWCTSFAFYQPQNKKVCRIHWDWVEGQRKLMPVALESTGYAVEERNCLHGSDTNWAGYVQAGGKWCSPNNAAFCYDDDNCWSGSHTNFCGNCDAVLPPNRVNSGNNVECYKVQ